MSWDPEQYSRFTGERSKPLGDLLDRIPERPFREILDLGCGTGIAIPLIAGRWPRAEITALDNSREMLAAAGKSGRQARFIEADIASWAPDRAYDLILSNAALQWLDQHEILFPRLMAWLAPGGQLAVQMPNNWAEPSHRLLGEIAGRAPWREKLAPILRQAPVGDADFYREILAPLSQSFEVWENIYQHALPGADAVYRWIEGTSLKPLLDALDGKERRAFAGQYKEALAAAYGRDDAGITHFPFRRLFILAVTPD